MDFQLSSDYSDEMKKYKVKEVFYTLQGEGVHAGRPAVFCRFSGCNLWSGREEDRHSAICQFCDTDFRSTDGVNGGTYSADELTEVICKVWGDRTQGTPFVVCTGGEPLLQLDENLTQGLSMAGFEIAIETNGTLPLPKGVDWVCVSPKANTEIIITSGDELKLVFPQARALPSMYEKLDFKHFLIQPMDGPHLEANTKSAVEFCLKHPQWHLSLQTHKLLGIP